MIKINNTYNIECYAKYLYKPKNVEELEKKLAYLKENNIEWYVLGSGSNVILPDTPFNGAIISLQDMNSYSINKDLVFAYAGINLNTFIMNLINLGYTNLAKLYGIPGMLGGAIYGNAGANNKDIFSDLVSVLVYDTSLKTLNKESITYGYRTTSFKNTKAIILGATFKLEKGDKEEALNTIKGNMKIRREKQPLELPNAGSVFKNPSNCSAGRLIDECNLKGLGVNDACISMKHANFIVNIGHATSKDIKTLIKKVQEEVKKQKNIDLELEQVIVEW